MLRLLARLEIGHGNVHLLYTGNSQHTNLLTFASRFLITADDVHQTTSTQHRLAIQINSGIDSTRQVLTQVYQDAKQLMSMTDAQLLQEPALVLLNDMATQAQYASTGQPDPATGTTQSGALWIYNNLQRLATFEIAPYTAKKDNVTG